MDTIIKITTRNAYGTELIDPANTQAARLRALVGNKTLTIHTLTMAKAMGFEIQIVTPTSQDLLDLLDA
jgi:hypothetical protein